MTDPRDVRIAQLTDALKSASDVMNHFGDVLNGMDCVAEVEEDTGVPNSWVDGVFEQVRTALTPKPDAPPNPAAEPEPINYHRAVEHLSGRIETLEGALRRADDRLAAIHEAFESEHEIIFGRLMSTTPTLIEEGEKALCEEEPS